MKQKVPNRYNKLQKPFLDIAHCLIMGTKKWQMSILGESKHLKQLKHFLRICSETSDRSTLIFSKLLMTIYTFIRKLKCQPLPFIGLLPIFVTFLRCSCIKIRIYSHLQDHWINRKPVKVIFKVIVFLSTISSCVFLILSAFTTLSTLSFLLLQ